MISHPEHPSLATHKHTTQQVSEMLSDLVAIKDLFFMRSLDNFLVYILFVIQSVVNI